MADPVTLRTDAGDEHLDLAEFEARLRRGEVSPQCLVRLPGLTPGDFVPACELELYQRLHEPKRAYFSRAFGVFSRFPWITAGLILGNIALFLATAQGGVLELDDMVRAGAKVGPLVSDLGEVWRLLTANFLHRDAVHLGLNMFVLFNVGGALENTYRTLDYLWLLVFSGIATMTTSLVWNDAVTIGASGMVFGCLGGVVAFGLKYRSLLPPRYRSILGDAAIPTVLGFLLIGLTSQGVDNWAHVGGLLAGMVTGAFMRPRLLTDVKRSWWEPAMRAAPSLGVLAVVLFGHIALADFFPRLHAERDDVFGLMMPVPKSWVRGADTFGSVAYFNGLSGAGRASVSAEAIEMPESADAARQAQRFIDETLDPRRLGQDVIEVRHEAVVTARVADRDGLKLKALIIEPGRRTRLAAYFVERGNFVYQLVFLWPDSFPRYAHVSELMLAGVRFEETRALRQARAEALLFPNAPVQLARLGLALYEEGELVPAVEALAAAVRSEPSNVRYRVALSRAALASGDVDRACASAKDAVVYDANDAFALEADARCELARGNTKRALERLGQARASAPGDERLKSAESKLRTEFPGLTEPGR